MNRILLLGAPGSGKSTQAEMLARELNYKWISSGELFRARKDKATQEQLKTAKLFSDQDFLNIMQTALENIDGAVLEGFPRTPGQLQMVTAGVFKIDFALEVQVPEEILLDRVIKRGRDQDAKEIAEERIKSYFETSDEIIKSLKQCQTPEGGPLEVISVSGVGTPDEVHARIMQIINGKIAKS